MPATSRYRRRTCRAPSDGSVQAFSGSPLARCSGGRAFSLERTLACNGSEHSTGFHPVSRVTPAGRFAPPMQCRRDAGRLRNPTPACGAYDRQNRPHATRPGLLDETAFHHCHAPRQSSSHPRRIEPDVLESKGSSPGPAHIGGRFSHRLPRCTPLLGFRPSRV